MFDGTKWHIVNFFIDVHQLLKVITNQKFKAFKNPSCYTKLNFFKWLEIICF